MMFLLIKVGAQTVRNTPCSPELEVVTLMLRPFYLPRELTGGLLGVFNQACLNSFAKVCAI